MSSPRRTARGKYYARPIRHSEDRKVALNRNYCRSVTIQTLGLKAYPSALDSPVPILSALPLHRDAGRIADLDPDLARPRSIGAVDLLGYDALGAKRACIRWAHTLRRCQPHAKIKRPRWRVLIRSHTLPSFEAGGYSDG